MMFGGCSFERIFAAQYTTTFDSKRIATTVGNRRNENSNAGSFPESPDSQRCAVEKPLFVYDADCVFCIRWVRRWQETTRRKC